MIAVATGQAAAEICVDFSPTLNCAHEQPYVAHPVAFTGDGEVADPVSANEGRTYTHEGENNFRMHNCVGMHVAMPAPRLAIRRLTATECERLQGLPDNWTNITYKGKPAADGPRYKAIGNSMATNCMAWIGQRIAMVDALVVDSPPP